MTKPKTVSNDWHYFEVNGSALKVKELGLLEILSMAVTFYRQKLRKDLKEIASDLFGEDPQERVQYVIQKEDKWPKGEDLTNESMSYLENGECQDSFCIYALHRFNGTISTTEEARDIYDAMASEDQTDLISHLFKTMREASKAPKDDSGKSPKKLTK